MVEQEEIFKRFVAKYDHVIPNMMHGSGGLLDTKGKGTSDVDIVVCTLGFRSLARHLPYDTVVKIKAHYATYQISGYERRIELFATNDKELALNSVKHRETELALSRKHPKLARIAFAVKKENQTSTEKAWARALNIEDTNYMEILKDTDKVLKIAEENQKVLVIKVIQSKSGASNT